MGFREDCSVIKLWDEKVIVCSELSRMFCGNLSIKSIKRNADNKNLVCDDSQGTFDS